MYDVNEKCYAFKQVQYFKSLDIFILHKEETFFIFYFLYFDMFTKTLDCLKEVLSGFKRTL